MSKKKERIVEFFHQLSTDASDVLQNISENDESGVDDSSALENLLLTRYRPMLVVDADTFQSVDNSWNELLEQARPLLNAVIPAVGRIELAGEIEDKYTGSGVLVGKDLFLTCSSCVNRFVTGSGLTARLLTEADVRVNFRAETNPANSRIAIVEAVVLLHPAWDLALLRLTGDLPPHAKLASTEPLPLVDTPVALIGHPTISSQGDMPLQQRVFEENYHIKRLMPGNIRGHEAQYSSGRWVNALVDDASTIGQSRGAAVISLTTGEVIGLHFAGDYLVGNYSIPSWELAKDRRLRENGLIFETPLPEVEPSWVAAWDVTSPQEEPSPNSILNATGIANDVPQSRDRNLRQSRLNQLADWLAKAIPDISGFRSQVKETAFAAAERAVRGSSNVGYYQQFVEALDRRTLIDRTFFDFLQTLSPTPAQEPDSQLNEIASALGVPLSSGKILRDGALIPQQDLAALRSVLAEVKLEPIGFSYGSQYREILLDCDEPIGYPIIEKLATSTNADAMSALKWTLKKLREISDSDEIREKISRVLNDMEGGANQEHLATDDWQRLPFQAPRENLPINVFQLGLDASAAVASVSKDGRFVCTGWLLTRSLLVIPTHVLYENLNLNSVLDHKSVTKSGSRLQVKFADSEQSYKVKVAAWDEQLDITILRLDRRATAEPLRVSPGIDVMPHDRVILIYHLEGGMKRFSEGYYLEHDGQDLVYMAVTGIGTSGAPVLNRSFQVIATHRAWRGWRTDVTGFRSQAKLGTAIDSVLEWLCSGTPALWGEVVSAQPSLKSIDEGIYQQLRERQEQEGPQARVAFSFRVYGRRNLHTVPDLIIGSESGGIFTATGTQRTIESLVKLSNVLSIQLSRASGALECRTSVPRTGAVSIRNLTGETGANAIIGVIDTGIDVLHKTFLDGHGRSRVLAFWDQLYKQPGQAGPFTISEDGTKLAQTCPVVKSGALYDRSDIQTMIDSGQLPASFPDRGQMQHGTSVCSIAAGRATGPDPTDFTGGMAPDAKLIVVRYDVDGASIGYSNGHMDGLEFIESIAKKQQLPVVVNISNGMNSGAHDGTTPLEARCNAFCLSGPGRVIVKSAGNERGIGRHAQLTPPLNLWTTVPWQSKKIPNTLPGTDRIEIWFPRRNEYEFQVQPPSGAKSPIIRKNDRFTERLENGNLLSVHYMECHASNTAGHVAIEILPGDLTDVQSDIWCLHIKCIKSGVKFPMHLWIEISYRRETEFLDHVSHEYTLTIPGTAEHVICVGAIDVQADRLVEASRTLTSKQGGSSFGPACVWKTTPGAVEKPDLVAPGASIRAALARSDVRVDGDNDARTGTSVSAPHVTGAVALLLSRQQSLDPTKQFTAQTILASLIDNSRNGPQPWDSGSGYGELDVQRAFQSLYQDLV